MSRKVNIEIEQGATFQHEIELLNTDNTAFDVTSWSGEGSIRKHYLSETSYEFSVSLANGVATFSMPASNTAALEEGLYVYDVRIVHTSNVVHRVVSGMAYVSPGVTR